MDKKLEKLVELGSSHKPHGIKGAFLFKLFNHEQSVLSNGALITIFPASGESSVDKSGVEVEIESIHFGNKTICYLKGIRDRNIVEQMIPFNFSFPRDKFPETDSNELYISDLRGLIVFNIDGYEIGVVDSYYDNGAQVILKLKLENEKIELPFVEAFFPHVDVEKGRITLIEPEYD